MAKMHVNPNRATDKAVRAIDRKRENERRKMFIFARALELTKAYAGSGAVTHYSAVTRLFYDLFDMFESGRDPRDK